MKIGTKCLILTLVLLTSVLPVLAQNRPFSGRLLQLIESGKATSSRTNDQEEGVTTVTVQSGGIARTYHTHIPPSYNNSIPMPIVFVFHGGSGTGLGMVRLTHMNREADRQGFIVAYPEGLGKHWNDGRAKYAKERQQDDVGFVQDIVKKLESEMNIDKTRIYVCGISNGGLFCQRLACEAPDTFAAAASIAANFPTDCGIAPSKPFSIMYMLGTDDPLMVFRGGDIKGPLGGKRGKVLSGDQSVETWVKYDRCPTKPVFSTYGEPGANLSIESRVYQPGINGSEVVYCLVLGGGHCWPGGKQYLTPKLIGYASPISANEIIWNFFSRHKLGNNK